RIRGRTHVSSVRRIRQRQKLEILERDRIQPRLGNDISRKRRGGIGVNDRRSGRREVTRSLCRRGRESSCRRSALADPKPLRAAEPEQLVLDRRSAHAESKLILVERRILLQKELPRGQGAVVVEFPNR